MGRQLLLNEKLEWFHQNDLLKLIKDNYKYFIPILKDRLQITDETCLIIGDKGYPVARGATITTGCYMLAAEELGLDYDVVIQNPKSIGENADNNVINALLNLPEKNVVIATLSGKFGSLNGIGRSFRKFCINKKHRFASAMDLKYLNNKQYHIFVNTVNTNYELLNQRANFLKTIFDDASELKVTTPAGTNLYFNIEGIKTRLNTGNYSEPGTGGNIPAGEVYLPPTNRGVEGKVVIDGSFRTRRETSIVKNPVTLTINKGEVVGIEGENADSLKESLDWAYKTSKNPEGVKMISELGIGINPDASLAGPTIINEKMLGTAHVAIGSNYWFGGDIYAKIHLDQVFKQPRIEADGKIINPNYLPQ